jgi:hypothetical protein
MGAGPEETVQRFPARHGTARGWSSSGGILYPGSLNSRGFRWCRFHVSKNDKAEHM